MAGLRDALRSRRNQCTKCHIGRYRSKYRKNALVKFYCDHCGYAKPMKLVSYSESAGIPEDIKSVLERNAILSLNKIVENDIS